MRFPDFKPTEIEPNILRYWEHNKILEKLRERNKNGKKFYFLQGPPYTSGRIHLGHAWNHALKDLILRYKRMNGFNVWDRAGYDMHGLPTEHKVMEKFNLKTKEDIISFGVGKFSDECLKFSTEMAALMNKDLHRLGVTLDFANAYMPITETFIEGEWFLIKKAHEQERLYLGERSLHWCANCETALAKHECEYKNVKDSSVYVKFPVKGKKNEYLVIWTTTPWTLAFNLAVMANPKVDYVKVKVGNEKWIVAKALAGPSIHGIAEKEFEIIEEFKGDALDKIEYAHPWADEIPAFAELKKKHLRVHTVVLNEEYVTTDTGTGLVHCAPGCGPEDYEVGHFYKIPPFNTISQAGIFSGEMGKFSGLRAKKHDQRFIEAMEEEGMLIAQVPVDHEYAHCQRCHKPVVFKTTPQWFFKVEDLKEKMLKANQKISWVPQEAKNAFTSWLENLRDNSITKQRFWGTPVPIWQCENQKCRAITVIGSVKELEKHAKRKPERLHKPWIDEITFPCDKCSSMQKRVPDILDVWIDAGTTSWNCLDYPRNKELLKEWFPAEFILEGKDQIRGWFNLLMVASFLAFGKPPFRNVYMHGFITDVEGVKMSKSLGNIVSPYEAIDKHGADVLRAYMCQARAGEDINFSWDEIVLTSRNLNVLWNVHKFLIQLAKDVEEQNEGKAVNPFSFDHTVFEKVFDIEERWLFSRLHSTMQEVTEKYGQYQLDGVIAPVIDFFLEVSRTYIQLVREKSSSDEQMDRELVLHAVSHSLLSTLLMLAPAAPFLAEAMFLNLKEAFKLREESIHHWEWPHAEKRLINKELEERFAVFEAVLQSALAVREKIGFGLRWPLKEAIVVTKDKKTIEAVEQLKGLLAQQLNVKNISVLESLPGMRYTIRADYEKLGPLYGELTPKIIAKLVIESPESILRHLEKEGEYFFVLNGADVAIKREHLIIAQSVPEPFKEGAFKGGFVYLSAERTEELENEGFARELTRIVQQLRKEANLEKKDRILLYVGVPAGFEKRLMQFAKEMQSKVGAEKMIISSAGPARRHAHQAGKTIKGQKFEVMFDMSKFNREIND